MKKVWAFMAGLMFFFSAFVGTAQADSNSVFGQEQGAHNRAMWVWNFDSAASTEDQRDQLIQFSMQNHIDLLYMNTGGVLPDHQTAYASLIQTAHQKGIRVYALDGNASWALTENHPAALQRIQQVLDYNTGHPDAKFDGIEYDVEPYILPEFWANVQGVGSQYLDLLVRCKKLLAQQADMKFDAAIPFWYALGNIDVTYNGAQKPLSYQVLDIVDTVSIMAYRHTADGQISASQTDVDYAASIGKKAYVGAETSAPDGSGIPDFITYYNYGTHYMDSQFKLIDQHYESDSGYGGIAIEWYDAWKSMAQ